MDVLSLIGVVFLLVWCFGMRRRMAEMDERIELLEGRSAAWAFRTPEPVGERPVDPKPFVQTPVAAPPPLPAEVLKPIEVVRPVEWVRPSPVAAYVAPVEPSLGERVHAVLGDEEWEAVVGGSLLNKAGAVVLVIGIALLLGYSFGHITPAGRLLTALLLSGGLLGGGVWLERRDKYRAFSRGLIGAGWAGLYASAYASYAVPEMRVTDNPFTGSIAMVMTAIGMIGHSLKYRAQAVTGVAYGAAFAALAVSPSSPFAVVSLIPLAGSLLWLAARFNWYSMGLFGMAATYATCISRGDSGVPLWQTQSLFFVYWAIFDGFDLLRVKRGAVDGGVEWIYPANTLAFLGLSYAVWLKDAPQEMWVAAAAGAALFLADAVVRWPLVKRELSFAERVRAGGFEASALIGAALGALAIVGRVDGLWMSAALAVEAEAIYLAGAKLESEFLRRVGVAAFVHSLAREVAGPFYEKSMVFGYAVRNGVPVALFHAGLFYFNRVMRLPNLLMSWTAAGLVAWALVAQVPAEFAGLAWIVYGAALAELGTEEFRQQAWVLFAGGFALNCFDNNRVGLGLSAGLLYGATMRGRAGLSYGVRLAMSGATVALVGMVMWRVMPVEWLALGWSGLALVALEAGLRGWPSEMRLYFGPAAGAGVLALFETHSADFVKFAGAPVWVSCAAIAVIFGLAAFLWNGAPESDLKEGEKDVMWHSSFLLALIFTMTLVWLETLEPYVTGVWMILGVGLVARRGWEKFGYLAGGFVLLWAFAFCVEPAQLMGSVPVIAGLYAGQYLLERREAAGAYSVAGALLLAAVLYGKVSGGLLTVSWGVAGLALLVAGFVLRTRILRLQGLGLLAVCILKLFLYDLRNLETVFRILSFVGLGLIMLAVSWCYTRFREQLKRVL
jgi:uncharacterized membrane protein